MKKVVIEIDGVKHQLVDEGKPIDECAKCSLSNLCDLCKDTCLCIDLFRGTQYSFFKKVDDLYY